MHTIIARNVAEALPLGVQYLLNRGKIEQTRAGEAMVAPGPVMTCYTDPRERVLTSPVRDANPFFHLAEIAWMLTGMNEAEFLNHFVSDFGSRFAEESGVIHGAYGHRWRREFDFDQLDHVVEMLRKNPESRQAVIQMWDARPRKVKYVVMDGEPTEYTYGCDDLRGKWSDRPCNTHVYLRVRREQGMIAAGHGNVYDYDDSYLDITVCCRSNDIIWGAYGANAVHFSALQEYLAARIGCKVGYYYQFSNNYHMYIEEVQRITKRAQRWTYTDIVSGLAGYPYKHNPNKMVSDPDTFVSELSDVILAYETHKIREWRTERIVKNLWIDTTLGYALEAHYLWKNAQKHSGLLAAKNIACPDWQKACVEWMERRFK